MGNRINIGRLNPTDIARANNTHERTGLIEVGRVDPVNRGTRAARHIARPTGRADEGYNVYEIAPGVEVRAKAGIQVALSNVGTEEVPLFLLTPGAMIRESEGFSVSGAMPARTGEKVGYTCGVLFLLPLIGPVTKAVGKEVRRVKAKKAAENGEDDDGSGTDADGKATTEGMIDMIGALMIDSDGHRTDTDD